MCSCDMQPSDLGLWLALLLLVDADDDALSLLRYLLRNPGIHLRLRLLQMRANCKSRFVSQKAKRHSDARLEEL